MLRMDKMLLLTLFAFSFGKLCLGTTVLTNTPTGPIEGFVAEIRHNEKVSEVTSYLGIPYAEPPIWDLRFAKPVKKGKFEKPFSANQSGPSCIQMEIPSVMSEDCLTLNIIVPGSGKKSTTQTAKAVIVFIYGRWWQYGLQTDFYAPGFAAGNYVILVTMNYRMNAYGFLAHEEYGLKGNYGLWDQQMAIQWVHDNIAAFGGDVNRVTIVGHSAGAASVLLQLLYPGNQGLFQGVIAQSGSPIAPWAYNKNYKTTFLNFIERCGCDSLDKSETVECLRNLNSSKLDVDYYFITSRLHLPVYDGEFITFSPEDFNLNRGNNKEFLDRLSSVNLMIGLTSSDGSWNYRRWGYLTREQLGGSFEIGISETQFRTLSKDLDNMLDLDFSVLEENAIAHQYLDWSDPDDIAKNRDAFLDLSQDLEFTANIYKVANAHAQAKGKGQTFVYEFDHRPSFADLPEYIEGPIHQDDLPYTLGFPRALMNSRGIAVEDPTVVVTRQELELSAKMQSLWTTFAKLSDSSNLSAINDLPWPQYTVTDGEYLLFRTDNITTKTFYRGNAVHFWNSLMPEVQAGRVQGGGTCSGEPVQKSLGALTLLAVVLGIILASR